MAESFQFELVSPERLLASEAVTAVQAPGTDGYMTVMARHAPLMTTLKAGVVVATLASGTERRFFVRGGFADVSNSGFTLLAERAVPVEELSAADLDAEIRNAEEDVADAKTPEAKTRADMLLSELRDSRAAVGI
ncbi:ATP synthase F1 subunit epsilon [Aureimonas sp. Leaf454]|uniref:F0F1 ATP synthase subunit epsilon n=1 Tax=Aureimonas sp. Leaf454 TaxID=1736381 RepID=UPI0006F7004F|nr:F0F1 ATP synthase subunit epsilon [Aureimonas sp. Leaf454]KQT47557.1 ATP synthase F1 subunit epsilon [Aureimonas sp. Leaf454]